MIRIFIFWVFFSSLATEKTTRSLKDLCVRVLADHCATIDPAYSYEDVKNVLEVSFPYENHENNYKKVYLMDEGLPCSDENTSFTWESVTDNYAFGLIRQTGIQKQSYGVLDRKNRTFKIIGSSVEPEITHALNNYYCAISNRRTLIICEISTNAFHVFDQPGLAYLIFSKINPHRLYAFLSDSRQLLCIDAAQQHCLGTISGLYLLSHENPKKGKVFDVIETNDPEKAYCRLYPYWYEFNPSGFFLGRKIDQHTLGMCISPSRSQIILGPYQGNEIQIVDSTDLTKIKDKITIEGISDVAFLSDDILLVDIYYSRTIDSFVHKAAIYSLKVKKILAEIDGFTFSRANSNQINNTFRLLRNAYKFSWKKIKFPRAEIYSLFQ